EAKIDFEIVPGVTAGIAAAEYSGIMLTDRQFSSQVVFVTGREADAKAHSNIDWPWLAKFKGSIVFYMSVGNLEAIVEQLLSNGMDAEMPAAVVANATLPSQKVIQSPLASISDKCKKEKIEPPAVVIIGTGAGGESGFNWFSRKPLFGKNIVVTRDIKGNAEFAAKIAAEGGAPIQAATIRIKPLTEKSAFLQAIGRINEYDWLIFTSANGVKIFFEALKSLNKDARAIGRTRVACIGSETAEKLEKFGIICDFVPNVYTSSELGKGLIGSANLNGKKVLLLRSKKASGQLREMLSHASAEVDEIALYDVLPQRSEFKWLEKMIADGKIDWITFASPSSARSFFEQVSKNLVNSSNAKVASIGPVTSEQLKELKVKVDATAKEHTIKGLIRTIQASCK
ncbi:MAG: uroporphyrinogen-III synthase, partial [Sedimentisphaerales bacterium]|nr:uroporphyrinogen-III synthase [Sedimentisphaerales bacterium]